MDDSFFFLHILAFSIRFAECVTLLFLVCVCVCDYSCCVADADDAAATQTNQRT